MRRIALIVVLVRRGGGRGRRRQPGVGFNPRCSNISERGGQSGQRHRQAARLLGLVALPAGVVRSATEPAGDQRGLSEPSYDEATPNLVDANAWWTTTASPVDARAGPMSQRTFPPGRRAPGSPDSGPPGTVPDAVRDV